MNKMNSKNMAVLLDFVEYCKAHPQERFWQALRNWSGHNFIFAAKLIPADITAECQDTFYWEGKTRVNDHEVV